MMDESIHKLKNQLLSKVKTSFLLLFVALLEILAQRSVLAAKLTRAELILDGSSNPPGDKLSMALLFNTNEGPLTLELRAYTLDSTNPPQIHSVKSSKMEAQDTNGTFLLKETIFPSASNTFVLPEFVIPYASLQLPTGTNIIGYELTCLNATNVECVKPTRLSEVIVSESTRRLLFKPVERLVETIEIRRVEVHSTTRVGPFHILAHEQRFIEVPERKVRTVVEQVPEEVVIPSGYRRMELAAPITASIPVGEARIVAESVAYAQKPVEPGKKVVFFATNRNVKRQNSTTQYYGDELASGLSYGSAIVNIPIDHHKRGNTELPTWWWQKNPELYFSLDHLTNMPKDGFLHSLFPKDSSNTNDILMLVHGFNNTFEFTLLRLAQLAYDIEFQGRSIAFSWPSKGEVQDYRRDEGMAERSDRHLADCLDTLVGGITHNSSTGIGKIHLIAHSMGNRVLLKALRRIQPRISPGVKPFGHIVLAAADIDAQEFVNAITSVFPIADSVSLYVCGKDKALLASRTIHVDKRVGEGLFCLPPLENIDASKLDTSWLSHDYFVSSDPLLIDLQMLLCWNRRPSNRPTLRSVAPALACEYWRFP